MWLKFSGGRLPCPTTTSGYPTAWRIQPLLPDKVRGMPRVDDRRVISGIVHLIRNGLRWRAAPPEYGPTLYNRFVRWSKAGLHLHLRGSGRREPGDGDDRRHPQLTGPRPACSKRGSLNAPEAGSTLHAVCDGRPPIMLLTEGQVSRGAATVPCPKPMPRSLPRGLGGARDPASPAAARGRSPATPNSTSGATSSSACSAE